MLVVSVSCDSRAVLQLGGVCKRIVNQVNYVGIRERVVDVRSFAPPANESFTAQQPQPLRDGGELVAKRLHNLCHAVFAFGKQFKQPQPRSIP